MARFGSNLLKEKTNVGVTTSTTFNSPGTYTLPYGKTVVRIGGRGASGNPATPGNFSYSNPGLTTSYYTVHCVYRYFGNYYFQFAGNFPGGGGNYVTYSGYEPAAYTCYYNYQSSSFTPGQQYFNPVTPGNAGSSATIGGITFPGGNAGSSAPVIGQTASSLKYESSTTLSITVPTGGYVTVDNITGNY